MEFFKKAFKALRFNKNKPTVFGELEEKVINIIWEKKSGTVSEVREILGKEKFAHTTIMTILDRLYKKGILKREKEGKGYRYFPLITKEEFEREVAKKVIKDIVKGKPDVAIAAFEGVLEELSQEEIKKLKHLIQQKVKDEE
ncbi:MAG: BlaI/MecI/CopY family transcriptional regulator [Aquificae bacterium]|nr:BlaI/MecI/CopY family transcriptional regulator [Aquificota bacterium]